MRNEIHLKNVYAVRVYVVMSAGAQGNYLEAFSDEEQAKKQLAKLQAMYGNNFWLRPMDLFVDDAFYTGLVTAVGITKQFEGVRKK